LPPLRFAHAEEPNGTHRSQMSAKASKPPADATLPPLLLPRVPAPLQRLFDAVPLLTYPADALPERSPARGPGASPVLHVFVSEDGAARGEASFNPTCLRWQVSSRLRLPPQHMPAKELS
jgi:hypothetical protein